MGNAFEAPTETAWGNPWQPEYFEIMAEMGFQHVRLPIRWETNERSLPHPPYTIKEEFLERIREVVDLALEQNLSLLLICTIMTCFMKIRKDKRKDFYLNGTK
jgi:aryl-phospho-beta-D-glucosidase BglC (GH1 family)